MCAGVTLLALCSIMALRCYIRHYFAAQQSVFQHTMWHFSVYQQRLTMIERSQWRDLNPHVLNIDISPLTIDHPRCSYDSPVSITNCQRKTTSLSYKTDHKRTWSVRWLCPALAEISMSWENFGRISNRKLKSIRRVWAKFTRDADADRQTVWRSSLQSLLQLSFFFKAPKTYFRKIGYEGAEWIEQAQDMV